MTRIRCITEMGMSVDVHGKGAAKAGETRVVGCEPPFQVIFLGETATCIINEVKGVNRVV